MKGPEQFYSGPFYIGSIKYLYKYTIISCKSSIKIKMFSKRNKESYLVIEFYILTLMAQLY